MNTVNKISLPPSRFKGIETITMMWIFWMLTLINIVYGAYSPEMESQIRSETVEATSYDHLSRPVTQTEISVGFHVLAIDSLDLKTQRFTVVGWLTFEWVDQRLSWNKTARDDIGDIFSDSSAIWKPEIVVDNSLDSLGIITSPGLLSKVHYDGRVDWEPPLLFNTHCEIDITYYPYDKQKCGIEIVSWGMTYDEVNLSHLYEYVNLEDFQPHGEWIIYQTEIEDKNLTEHTSHGTVLVYPQLEFWIYMERRTAFYNINVILLILLMSILIVLVFIVPVHSGEKLQLVLTVLLSLFVLMTITSDSLPPTSVTISILGLYLGMVVILSGFAVLLTVMILVIFHKDGKPKQGSCIMIATCLITKMTCWKTTDPDNDDVENVTKVKPFNEKEDEDDETVETGANMDAFMLNMSWNMLAEIWDRFCFFMFLIVAIVMNISFITILAIGAD